MNKNITNAPLGGLGGLILIADGGSTKADWSVVEKGSIIQRIYTKGINPFFQTEEEIGEEMRKSLIPHLNTLDFENAYFYGAGCIFEKVDIIKRAIKQNLNVKGSIEVNSDMLGAARGVCGRQSGIACILGTGSNSCFYNGKDIVSNVSPLGFILGDEGSGAVLGKLFVSDLLKNQLTPGLKEKFLKKLNLTPADVIDKVYRKPYPNRFLASFAPFISEHKQDPTVHALVLNGFIAFLKRNVMQYEQYNKVPVHFVGSVAYYFNDILQEAVLQMGIQMGNISQSPMNGLVLYHQ